MKLTANPAWLSLPPNRGKGSGAKFLRIMKLTTIIILAACLHTSAKGVAQQTITFSGKEVSLESVFSAIKKQTNYRFFFNTDMLSTASKVTLEVKNAQVEQVMNMALKDQPLTFTIKGRTIFVMKKQEEEKKSTQVERTGDPITVSGRVTDENGEPLAGANVKVKGGNNGVTTDGQGRFTLSNVDPNASLEISFVGHETEFLSVKGKTVFSVALGQRVGTLDETVVIAYGTTTKRFNTGNISSVKASDIEKQPVNNPLLALQGRVPGLFISQNTGVPGGGVTVRVQGINSIRSGNDPLYVIDGVPYFSQLANTGLGVNILGKSGSASTLYGTGNPLNYINPLDIESIEVLKDADATAIYGSRAANGAILITTKRGKSGRNKVDFNLQQGWGKVPRKLNVLNRRQYLDMRYEALKNDGIALSSLNQNGNFDLTVWDTTVSTDWQNELIGNTAKYTTVNTSISGGTANVQYIVGGTYNKQTTVFPGDYSDTKGSFHFTINSASANQKFRMQASSSYMIDNNELPSTDFTKSAILFEPVTPQLLTSDGSINWAPNSSGVSTLSHNPYQYLFIKYKNKTKNLISNFNVSYQFLPGLYLKTSVGYTDMNTNDFTSYPLIAIRPEDRFSDSRAADYGTRELNSWIIEPQVSFNKTLWKGKIDFLVGSSFQRSTTKALQLYGYGFNSDEVLGNIFSATTTGVSSSYYSEYKYSALFGRLNYILNDRYIVNLSARRDGSSRFGPSSRFHNFEAIGIGWIFTSEEFIKNRLPFLSFGKIRGSYGITGNDQTDDYSFLNLYKFIDVERPYQNTAGIYTSQIFNPYLEWEETRKLQLGLELAFLNDRIILNSTYARNRSSNQLLSYQLPSTTGFSSIFSNFPATIQNTSLEFSLQTTIFKRRHFSWKSDINITVPQNKLVSFPNLETSTYSNQLIVGKPISFSRVYHFLGVNETTGTYIVSDSKGDPVTSPNYLQDANVILTTLPKFYGGLHNNLSFKGIELDFLFQFVKQMGSNNVFYNGFVEPGRFLKGSSNQLTTVLDRWQKPGDVKNIQKFTTKSSSVAIATGSDAGIADASFIRLKNMSLSWNLQKEIIRKLHLQNLRLFIQGQNLLTITNYKRLDPENQSVSALPPLKVYVIGLQIGL